MKHVHFCPYLCLLILYLYNRDIILQKLKMELGLHGAHFEFSLFETSKIQIYMFQKILKKT
jgi:hypothetical protein